MPPAAMTALAWGPALMLAAWAAFRLLGLEEGYPLVPLMAFTPYVAGVAVIVAGLIAWTRRWIPAAVAALAAVGLVMAMVPRAIGGADREGIPLRVMTANMMLGEAEPEALVSLVRDERIDVLTVQELTAPQERELRQAGLQEELRHTVLAPAPGSAGGGVYSRLPVAAVPRVPSSLAGPQPAVVVSPPGAGEARVFSFHPPPPTGPAATREWASDLATLPDPHGSAAATVVAGDFNGTLDHAAMREALDLGYRDAAERTGRALLPTWPNGRLFPPQVTIDHVLVDERAGIGDAGVRDLPGSDHRAVFAEVLLLAAR